MRSWTIIFVLTAGLFLTACSRELLGPEQRYKILSFFFDGVKPPAGLQSPDKTNEPKTGEVSGTSNVKGYWEHGPYAAKLCNACHEKGSNKLLMPVEELCVNCHTLSLTKRKVHGPLAAGGCRVCHDPHSSQYRFFLVADSRDFCFYCHKKDDVMRNSVHDGETQCTECHDAHVSDNDFLLK